jgi:YfiH family protein
MNTNSNIHYVNWPLPQVLAFTTTRQQPNSTNANVGSSPYDFFNLGLHVEDESHHVLSNRQLLASLLPDNTNIQWLDQVHGNCVVDVERVVALPPTADAMYTRQNSCALAIMTADCLPILVSNSTGSEVAAIHGGWRSLSKNIIAETFKKFTCSAENLHVWLGPCIGIKAFEVGSEVTEAFIGQNIIFQQAFKPTNNDKYLADLHLIAKLQLAQLGIKNIYQQSDCTYQLTTQYYSFRRDGKTGRMASVIVRN